MAIIAVFFLIFVLSCEKPPFRADIFPTLTHCAASPDSGDPACYRPYPYCGNTVAETPKTTLIGGYAAFAVVLAFRSLTVIFVPDLNLLLSISRT
jgi:hypothetical protein